MKHKRNWIIGLVLSVIAALIALQNAAAPTLEDTVPDSVITETIEISTPTYTGCAFVWAYHDAPELTEKVDASVRALDQRASAYASLFGEDCVYGDGHSTFGVMETDFYIRLSVEDLTTEEIFGDWIAQVLTFITQIPREEIQGNYGFVEFWFEKNDAEHLVLRVPIQNYLNEAQAKTGPDLFRMFYNPP
ncbi:MAG: hypothetical protein ACYC6R_17185 [Anaerolineales bacterium]